MSLSDVDETALVEQGEGPQTGGVAGASGAVSAVDALRLARRSGFRLEVDGDDLAFEAPDLPGSQAILRALANRKAEMVSLLCEERRAIVRWFNEHFEPSPLGQCAHCGGSRRADDPFVLVFVGEDRADFHASCHPEWIAAMEATARLALGIEKRADVSAEPNAAYIDTGAQ